jgi:hypothetical protein
MAPNPINRIQSTLLIDCGRRNGRKRSEAHPSRIVETMYGSTPVKAFPISPKEKAHRRETIPR